MSPYLSPKYEIFKKPRAVQVGVVIDHRLRHAQMSLYHVKQAIGHSGKREGVMDDEEYEAWLSVIDSLSEPDVLDFLTRHHHDWTSCDFCSELMTEGGGSIVLVLVYKYQSSGVKIPSKVVEAMCSATVGPIAEAEISMGSGPPMPELITLTKMPDCIPSLYQEVIDGFSPRWYNEQEWTLEDVRAFVLERAGLPNAPADFAKQATNAFHGCWHAGPVEACYECQDVIRQAN